MWIYLISNFSMILIILISDNFLFLIDSEESLRLRTVRTHGDQTVISLTHQTMNVSM